MTTRSLCVMTDQGRLDAALDHLLAAQSVIDAVDGDSALELTSVAAHIGRAWGFLVGAGAVPPAEHHSAPGLTPTEAARTARAHLEQATGQLPDRGADEDVFEAQMETGSAIRALTGWH